MRWGSMRENLAPGVTAVVPDVVESAPTAAATRANSVIALSTSRSEKPRSRSSQITAISERSSME